ncbi:MAG: serine/threonine protein kinase, partial [Nannocystaceae bacterium]|nr:serine/threonine protein kinase [Nannocystaceae bacterium]
MAVDSKMLGSGSEYSEEDGLETQLQMSGISRALFGESAVASRLGRFIVLEKIGAGAMGTVFRAYDPDLDRSVALKVIRSEALVRDSKARARMAREARTLAKLNHPNVVAVHEIGTADDQMYLALELVEGGDLARWLRENPDPRSRFVRALEHVMQAGEGLAAAHGAGLVHRDFKPANILLGTQGRVRVADFGLARLVDTDDALPTSQSVSVGAQESDDAGAVTRTNDIVGTPAYMAPEQRDGEVPDALSDQYAFCVTAWEALFGSRPSAGDAVPESRLSMTPHRRSLARVLARGLSLNRAERFGSMNALLVALARNPERRRRLWIMGLASVSVAVAAAAGIYMEREGRCDGVASPAHDVWSAEVAEEVRQGFEAVDNGGVPGSWDRFSVDAGTFVRRWADTVQESCRAARIHGTVDTATFEARMNCLDEKLARFEGLVDVYRTPDRKLVLAPLRLDSALGPLEACVERPGRVLDGSKTTALELARAVGVLEAGRPVDALALLEGIVERAESEGPSALLARGQLALGRARFSARSAEPSSEMLEQAFWTALEFADDATAARAARFLSSVLA